MLRLLDMLTLGIARKRAALTSRLADADRILEGLRQAGPRYTTVRPQEETSEYLRFIAGLGADERWQWFLFLFRERLIRQATEGTRTQTGDRDVYLGALVGLDLLVSTMTQAAAKYKELSTNASLDT